MSHKHTTTNAQETNVQETQDAFEFPERCFFVRRLVDHDGPALMRLYAKCSGTGDGVKPKYGVFNIQNILVGAYGECKEPFAEAVALGFIMQWMH